MLFSDLDFRIDKAPVVGGAALLICFLAALGSPATAQPGEQPAGDSATTGSSILLIPLDPEEQSWLAAHPLIRVHFDPWPPFVIDRDGRPGGITVDYLELIATQLNLEIEWVPAGWTQALEAIRNRERIDVLPILSPTVDRKDSLAFTRNYVSFPIVIFTRQESLFIGEMMDLTGRKVAVERDYAMQTRLKRAAGDLRLLEVETTLEALQAVATGSADAYIGNLAVGSYLIQEHGLANLHVAAPSPFGPHNQAIGVRGDWQVLARILDKGLAAITPKGHLSIRQRWLAIKYEHGLTTTDILLWVLGALLLGALIVTVISLRNRRLKAEVAQRRKTQTIIEQSRSRLAEAQRLARLGSFSVDLDPFEGKWSPESSRIFGCEPIDSTLDLQQLQSYLGPVEHSRFIAALEEAWSEQTPFEMEFSIRRPDGKNRHLFCRAEPSSDPNAEQFRRLNGTFRDITDQTVAKQEREQLETQIKNSQKLESLGVLAGGIAHDFNNLLAVIRGNTELALMDEPEQAVKESLTEVVNATKRATELCQQMLAYSGRGTFSMEAVDMAILVADLAQMLDISLSRTATLRLDFPAGVQPVMADPTQLRQVVMNLITNASDALGERNGSISLSTGSCEKMSIPREGTHGSDELPDGEYTVLEIRDTGSGMDEDTLGRLFDPFFSTKFAGRGLGMASVLGIVRAHRGAIHVWSQPEVGSAISVYLPVTDQIPVSPEVPASVEEPLLEGGGTVLVVDDELQLLKTISRHLVRRGFGVLTCSSGLEALELYQERHAKIDCVVLDLTMPLLDGQDVFRQIRTLDSGQPVVMMSGYHAREVQQRFGESERPSAFVQKPFELDQLVRAVLQVTSPSP